MDCHLSYRHDYCFSFRTLSLALLQLDITTWSKRKAARNSQVLNENQVFPLSTWIDNTSVLLDSLHLVSGWYIFLSNDYISDHSHDLACYSLCLVTKRTHTPSTSKPIHQICSSIYFFLSHYIVSAIDAKDPQFFYTQPSRDVPLFWTRVNRVRDAITRRKKRCNYLAIVSS